MLGVGKQETKLSKETTMQSKSNDKVIVTSIHMVCFNITCGGSPLIKTHVPFPAIIQILKIFPDSRCQESIFHHDIFLSLKD